jgi:hypothetical protein
VYGVVPPDAATALLYAAPTVPPGREVVVMVRVVLDWVEVPVPLLLLPELLLLLELLHPVRTAVIPRIRLIPNFCMALRPLAHSVEVATQGRSVQIESDYIFFYAPDAKSVIRTG